MHEIITILNSDGILGSVSNNIDILANLLDTYFSGANNLRMASIILMLLAFVMFLFLVIIIYVKSIVSFLKSDNKKANDADDSGDDILTQEDEERINELMRENELEQELEKELQRELDLARTEKEISEQKEKTKQQINTTEKEIVAKKATERDSEVKSAKIDLDWKKGKTDELERATPVLDKESLIYKQSTREIPELLGLIIDMLGRGVDDLKIAQTVMFRNQGKSSEDDILQTIDAVKDFIALCINKKFEKLPNAGQLPDEPDALYHLAQGDPTYALAMVEALMDHNIDKSVNLQPSEKKDSIYADISNQASTFGSLAAINDVHLATGAFELSIELAPNNVNAWSRLADMYQYAESESKAIWAYQNVLNMADEELYSRQVANANKWMSQHLYAQGNSLQAAKLYNQSKQFYDDLGINRRLDKQEVEIVEIIESHQKEEMRDTINKILTQGNLRQYSYAQ